MSCPSVWFRCHFVSEVPLVSEVPRRAILHFAVLALLAAFAAMAAEAQTSCTVSLATDGNAGTNGTGPGNPGDLRYCINNVESNGGSGSSINFDSAFFTLPSNSFIVLNGPLPSITVNVTITGLTAGSGGTLINLVTISGNGSNQIFTVNSGATVTITDLDIAGGKHGSGGGAILNNGVLTVANSTLYDNEASMGAGYGGAVWNSGAMTVTNCNFQVNEAQTGNAIYNGAGGTLTVTGSTFLANTADGSNSGGGAIYNDAGGTLTVTDSTFFSNWANSGGAISSSGTLTATNNTFYASTAAQSGGAIYNSGTLTAANNIFFANSAPSGEGGAIWNGGTINKESNNVYYSNSGGDVSGFSQSASDVTGKNLNLAPPGSYGGLPINGTMIPLPGSAAICAGSASAASSAGITADQRGFALDPACPSGAVDAGAIQTNQYMVTTTNDASDASPNCVGGSGSTCSLRDALTLNNVTAGDITFAPSLYASGQMGTITLGTGSAGDNPLPQITDWLNLLGPGANQITISGNNDANVGSIFTVYNNVDAFFYGVTIANGNTPGNGGAIYNDAEGTLTVTDSTLSANEALGGDGGAIENTGWLVVTGSTFSTNSALDGGAIWSSSSLEVANSTFSGNLATSSEGAEGGAIFSYLSGVQMQLMVADSTFSGNEAEGANGEGGAIWSDLGGTMATNNIFSGNSASSGGAINFVEEEYDGSITESYNDYDSTGGYDSVSGFTMSGTDQTGPANLSALGWYGGLTQTMIPLSGSSALCAGLASDEYYTIDQRGAPLATCSNSSYIDIGSVQISGNPPLIAVSPISGPVAGGTTVAITGSGLDSATAVNFGSTPAASFLVTAASGTTPAYVTAVSPAESLGTVDVTVTNSSGASTINPTDEFTYERHRPSPPGRQLPRLPTARRWLRPP